MVSTPKPDALKTDPTGGPERAVSGPAGHNTRKLLRTPHSALQRVTARHSASQRAARAELFHSFVKKLTKLQRPESPVSQSVDERRRPGHERLLKSLRKRPGARRPLLKKLRSGKRARPPLWKNFPDGRVRAVCMGQLLPYGKRKVAALQHRRALLKKLRRARCCPGVRFRTACRRPRVYEVSPAGRVCMRY